jgi:hypothetical protein
VCYGQHVRLPNLFLGCTPAVQKHLLHTPTRLETSGTGAGPEMEPSTCTVGAARCTLISQCNTPFCVFRGLRCQQRFSQLLAEHICLHLHPRNSSQETAQLTTTAHLSRGGSFLRLNSHVAASSVSCASTITAAGFCDLLLCKHSRAVWNRISGSLGMQPCVQEPD